MAVEIRFKLDEQLDEELIRKILIRGNGGSIHQAAKILMIEWQAIINYNYPQGAPNSAEYMSSQRQFGENETSLEEALADIDDVW